MKLFEDGPSTRRSPGLPIGASRHRPRRNRYARTRSALFVLALCRAGERSQEAKRHPTGSRGLHFERCGAKGALRKLRRARRLSSLFRPTPSPRCMRRRSARMPACDIERAAHFDSAFVRHQPRLGRRPDRCVGRYSVRGQARSICWSGPRPARRVGHFWHQHGPHLYVGSTCYQTDAMPFAPTRAHPDKTAASGIRNDPVTLDRTLGEYRLRRRAADPFDPIGAILVGRGPSQRRFQSFEDRQRRILRRSRTAAQRSTCQAATGTAGSTLNARCWRRGKPCGARVEPTSLRRRRTGDAPGRAWAHAPRRSPSPAPSSIWSSPGSGRSVRRGGRDAEALAATTDCGPAPPLPRPRFPLALPKLLHSIYNPNRTLEQFEAVPTRSSVMAGCCIAILAVTGRGGLGRRISSKAGRAT